jgi:hypothetical protein
MPFGKSNIYNDETLLTISSINQLDHDELSHHVSSKMLRIFRMAKHTLIWLGPENTKREGALAAKTIERIANEICINSKLARYEISSLDDPYDTLRELGSRILVPVADTVSPEEWKALRYFYSMPWFSRLWVVQEFNTSPDPITFCGQTGVDANIVAFVAVWSTDLPASYRAKHGFSLSKTNVRRAASMRRQLFRDRGTLFHILHYGRRYEATDPRDRVYAMLGVKSVATAWEKYGRANYKNMTKDIVYRNVVDSVLRSEKSLRIFSYVSHPKDQISRPSWVPQWDFTDAIDPLWWSAKNGWNAPGNRKLDLPWSHANLFLNDVFTVKGLEVSTITSVCKIPEKALGFQMHGKSLTEGQAERGAEWSKLLQPMAQYPNEMSRLGAYSQTLHCGLNEYGRRISKNDRDQAINLVAFLSLACGPHTPVSEELKRLGEERLKKVAQQEISFLAWNHGWASLRSFFRTSDGYIGMAPDCIQEGDRVCIIYGADVPFILRPVDNGWLLIGESYCHGLMEGEYVHALAQGRLPGVEDQDFRLV